MENSTENKENTTHGCLKFNDKIYPVYEGHNTIGRNPDAIINIKNLTVSKHHAVITILDNETHFISDFKSSSGTLLNNKKLTPLLLYKLNNGASIKFGNVHCTYKKLQVGNSFRKSIDETQQLSESFFAQQTQQMHTSNLPDGINFNDLPTQIFTTKDLNIHEMTTQLQDFSNTNESSNDSIDFMTMQKSTETQSLQNDAQPQKSAESLSQICPVALNDRKIIDSETDDELTPSSQLLTVKSAKKRVIESDSSDTEDYVIDKACKTKYHISDDSETEVEDEDLQKQTNEKSQVKNGEEETQLNILEDLNNSPILNKATPKINKELIPQDHLYCQAFSRSQIEFEKNEELLENREIEEEKENLPNASIFEEPMQKSHVESNLAKEEKKDEPNPQNSNIFKEATEELDVDSNPTNEDKNEGENFDSSKKKDEPKTQNHIFEETTQELGVDSKPTKEDKMEEEKESLDSSEKEEPNTLNPNIFEEQTQDLDVDLTPAKEEKENLDLPEKENSNIFEEATQELDVDTVAKDTIFLQPTQTVKEFEESLALEKEKSKPIEDEDFYLLATQAENVETTSKEDIYLQATQTMQINPEDSQITEAPNPSRISEIDYDVLPPTQALEILHSEENQSNVKDKSNTSTGSVEDVLPGTQALEQMLSDENKKDPFLAPAPSPSRKSTRKKPSAPCDDDDDILQPTQALEILHEDPTPFNKVEDQLQEIFASQSLLCTQQLVDVLNTSCDEIIDDSMMQQRRSLTVRNAEPLSGELVEDILAEDIDEVAKKEINQAQNDKSKKEQKINTRTRSKINETSADANKTTNENTKSKKKAKSQIEEKTQSEVVATTSRTRGRKKVEDEEKPVEDEGMREKPESSKTTKGRKLRRNLESFDEQNSEDSRSLSEKSEELATRGKNKEKSRESSVEINKSESQNSERSTRSTKNKKKGEVQNKKSDNKTDSQSNKNTAPVSKKGRPKKTKNRKR